MNAIIRGGNVYGIVNGVLFSGPIMADGSAAPYAEWGAVAFDCISDAEKTRCEAIRRELEARDLQLDPSVMDISWIDDNDGCGPRKLSRCIRCF